MSSEVASKELTNGPYHAKTYFRAYSVSDGRYQPAHSRRLIGAFSVRLKIVGCYRMSGKLNVRMILYTCAGWSESAHFSHVRMQFFSLDAAQIVFLEPWLQIIHFTNVWLNPLQNWMNSPKLYIGKTLISILGMSGHVMYIFLVKNGWTICIQQRHWSDAAFCDVWSRLHCLPNTLLGVSRLQLVNPFKGHWQTV